MKAIDKPRVGWVENIETTDGTFIEGWYVQTPLYEIDVMWALDPICLRKIYKDKIFTEWKDAVNYANQTYGY